MSQLQKTEIVIPAEALNPVFSRNSGPPLEFIPVKAGDRADTVFEFAITSIE